MSAFASLTVQNAALNKFSTEAAFSGIATALATNGASSATFGAYFTMDDFSAKYLILLHNSDADGASDLTVTIKAGNGLQGNHDISKTDLGNGEYTFVVIESGRFKNIAENDTLKALSSATAASQVSAKNKVFITGGSADIKVAVFKLP